MNAPKSKIGIIGLGYVGGAVYEWFKTKPKTTELFLYDTGKDIGSMAEAVKADVIFVAVPTPFKNGNGGFDGSAVNETVRTVPDGKTIVIKSTILPGTTAKLQKQYPRKKILFNPEFLRAKTAVRDFIHPDRQVLGVTNESKSEAEFILSILPKAVHTRVMTATEAEMVKYFGNTFLSTKVIFANQMYDLCESLGISYDAVKETAALDSRIGESHLAVNDSGYRGYGGSCFPKDTKALIQFARARGVSLRLLETIEEINKELNGDTWCD
jgi:UDPglucose 6-dehydrogenase